MKFHNHLAVLALFTISISLAQVDTTRTTLNEQEAELRLLTEKVRHLELTELVQSMSQRSLLTPSYLPELKGLVARQAYNFWIENSGEKYVSQLNIYSALYYANKSLNYDSVNQLAYNQIVGHDESVVSIEFGNQPNIFYSAGSDGKVLRWDLANLNNLPTVMYEGNHLIRSIDISDDDQWIMVVTKNQGVILVGTQSTLREGPQVLTDPEPTQAAIFLPDGLRYISINKQGEVRVKGYTADSARLGTTSSKVLSLAVIPDGDDFFVGTEAGDIEIWKREQESVLYIKDPYAINALSISSDQKMMAIGREKGDAIIWDLENKQILRTISGHQSAVTDVDFSPDNRLLLTASRDQTTRIWDIRDSKKLPLLLDDHEDWVRSACFDPSGKKIITGAADNLIRIWPVDPGELANRICEIIDRNLTEEEWVEYVGRQIPYQQTCD